LKPNRVISVVEATMASAGTSRTILRFVGLAALALAVHGAADAGRVIAAYRGYCSDYVQDYLSARAIGRGESAYVPVHPPDPAARVPEHPTPYANDHPPTYILALAPLGGLRYDQAFLVLGLASLLAAVGSAILVAGALGWGWIGAAILGAALLHLPGVIACLWAGNVSLVLAGLLTLVWIFLRRRADGRAGVCIGLATALKLFPGLLILGLVADRRWRAVLAVVLTGAVYLLVTVSVTGDDILVYATERAPANSRLYAGHGFNLSLTGVFFRTFGEPSPHSPWLGRLAIRPELAALGARLAQAIVFVLVLVRLATLRPAERTADRLFALLIPAMLLLSPLTWLHAIPMLLVPVAVLARDAWLRRRPARLAVLAAAVALLYVDDRALAIRLMNTLHTDVLPWTANFLLLLPTWGIAAILGLAAVGYDNRQPVE
jgi:hypothetical protein